MPLISHFLVFLFLVLIVANNVLVGLTVEDIRNFLENADLCKLTMSLNFILKMEWLARKNRANKELDDRIKKEHNLEASVTSNTACKKNLVKVPDFRELFQN